MIDDTLKELDRLLSERRPEYYKLLNPSISKSYFEQFRDKFDLALPEDFEKFYSWKNGQDPMSSMPLYQNRTIMQFDELVDVKEMLDGMIGYDFDDPKYWRKGWVPFLHNGGGSYLCLDLLAEDGGEKGQLIAFWKADTDRPVEHNNISNWLSWLVKSINDNTLIVC